MSSQDFSPAPYPFYAEQGQGVEFAPPLVRTRERYWLYILLFLLTLFSTTMFGVALQADFERSLPFDPLHLFDGYETVWRHPSQFVSGLPFSLTLFAILLAHEFGHYLACLYYRVDASLPYFLPAPTLIGTFGAFIRIRSAVYSKRALFDIGVAGPLAGFIFLLPALGVGLALSKAIPGFEAQGSFHFGISQLEWLLDHLIFPGVSPGDIYLHPVARAAWVGIAATGLNLLPIGQLDGGHILYVMAGENHRRISLIAIAALVPLAFFWPWWLGFAVLLFWLGRRHPSIYDPRDVGAGRRQLGWVALVIFVLCFMPVLTSGH